MKTLDKCNDYKYADEVKEKGIYPYFRAIQEGEGPVVRMEGKDVVMAGSNNYLGLTTHPKVKEASRLAIEKYGTSCSGSRFLTGTIDLHLEMEHKIAKFMGKESALLFSTGFQAGQGTIFPLMGRKDTIFSDRENHASIVASNMLASSLGVDVVRYKHNDMTDLEKRLSKLDKDAPKLIATDGVFSTFGDIVKLDDLTKLAKEYNANVVVDDAHAFGVIGEGGRGTGHHFGVQDDVDLTVCTFSKTLASIGGFVVGDERVINYLKHKSPALIFSASPTPANTAAAIAALEILEANPDLPLKLASNAQKVRDGLMQSGFNVVDGETAIVPIIIGDDEKTFKIWKMLYDEGIFVNAFIAPATPPGMQMLRTSYMASHTDEHIDYIIETFKKLGRQLGLI
ncbi:MAG: aminotransferase class I/II-fold pyridoxal phosphate-dependent enzyme [Chitinophagales bacterium]